MTSLTVSPTFQSPTDGSLTLTQVIHILAVFLATENSAYEYSLYIGSDSEVRKPDGETRYLTAIVVYRHGRGGRFFTQHSLGPIEATLRDRIWHETMLSTDLAKKLIDELTTRGLKSHIEIHCDIGDRGPTRELIREICGYVRGSGFQVAIKPDSCAASAVADRML